VPWVPRARESASGTRSLNLNAELLEPKSLSQEPMASAIGGVGKRFARSRSAKSVALDDVLPAVSASGHYFFGSSLPSRSGPISACGTWKKWRPDLWMSAFLAGAGINQLGHQGLLTALCSRWLTRGGWLKMPPMRSLPIATIGDLHRNFPADGDPRRFTIPCLPSLSVEPGLAALTC